MKRIIIKIIKINATTHINIPKKEARASGAVEKAIIPSKEYKNNFQKDHFVFPTARSIFS